MSSVVRSVLIGAETSSEIFDPKSENLTMPAWQIYYYFVFVDQKSKLAKFSINLKIKVVFPTDKMSSVVCSVWFRNIESENLTMPALPIFFFLKKKSKLTNFGKISKIFFLYTPSALMKCQFEPKNHRNFCWPQIWKFDHTSISDQKSKLTKFSINQQILVVTYEISTGVHSVSFATIKSPKMFRPEIWNLTMPAWKIFF